MGLAQSNINISKPVTLNRIRAECQKDPNAPYELKQFYADLLANDLNALGFEIPIQKNGKKRSPDDICKDIREATLPNVEALCMENADKKGQGFEQVEKMVRHFNKFYGARIPILQNPLNPKSGRRKLADICDDLYLVADKMRQRLSDHPEVIKAKLKQMIDELEYKKQQVQGNFSGLISSLAHSRDQDKMNSKLQIAKTMQDAIQATLSTQVNTAKDGFTTLIRDLKQNAQTLDGTNNTVSLNPLSGFSSQGPGLSNTLSHLSNKRWVQSPDQTDKIRLLMQAMKQIDGVTSGCTNCLNKFGMTLDQYNAEKDDISKLHPMLVKQFKKAFAHAKNTTDYQEIINCYNNLMNDTRMCSDNSLSMTNITAHNLPSLANAESIAAALMAGINAQRNGQNVSRLMLNMGSGTVI